VTSLDASALASIFVDDEHSPAVRRWLGARPPGIMVSTFAAAEFAAVVGRHVRMRHLGVGDGAGMLLLFDMWLSRDAETLEVEPEDHRVAASFVRRFDLGLRAPDALHIAACRRLGLSLLTFDRRQAVAAAALGVACDPAGAMAGPAVPSA
jgi:uncharacterized protein